MKLKCPNCGNVFELVEGKTECFCSNCGTKLKAPKPKEEVEVQEEQLLEEQKENEVQKEPVIGLVGFILGVVSFCAGTNGTILDNFTSNFLLRLLYNIGNFVLARIATAYLNVGLPTLFLGAAIVGIVLSAKGMKAGGRFKVFSIIGLVLSIVSIVLIIISVLTNAFNLIYY